MSDFQNTILDYEAKEGASDEVGEGFLAMFDYFQDRLLYHNKMEKERLEL